MSWVGHSIHSWVFPKAQGLPPLTLFGASRAAHGTGFAIPELGVQLDAGVVVHTSRPEHVLVTHSHTDHAHMLTHFRSRARPPIYYVPSAATNLVEHYMRAAQEMTNGEPFANDADYQVSHITKGVKPGDRFEILRGKETFVVNVLPCNHSVPTVGYGFSLRKSRLLAEYSNLEGRALGELRKQGKTITENFEAPMFCFMGDTHADIFDDEKNFSRYPVIITECTFLEETEEANARKKMHTVWAGESGLNKVVSKYPNTLFVLIHFSMKYTTAEITRFFQARALANVLVWASESTAPLTLRPTPSAPVETVTTLLHLGTN